MDDEQREAQRQLREVMATERNAYFERWRLSVEPLDRESSVWMEYAVSYGQIAIRSAFLLNGGALIAVPAFAQMMGDGIWVRGVVAVGLCFFLFVLGLIFAVLATGLSYRMAVKFSILYAKRRDSMAERVTEDYRRVFREDELVEVSNEFDETEEVKKINQRAERLSHWAAICAVVAFAWFVCGAIVAGYIISGAPPKLGG